MFLIQKVCFLDGMIILHIRVSSIFPPLPSFLTICGHVRWDEGVEVKIAKRKPWRQQFIYVEFLSFRTFRELIVFFKKKKIHKNIAKAKYINKF